MRCECGNILEPGDEMCDDCYAQMVDEYYRDRMRPLNFSDDFAEEEEEPEEEEELEGE